MIEGNNELAVALIMLLPLMFYLWQTTTHKFLRLALLCKHDQHELRGARYTVSRCSARSVRDRRLSCCQEQKPIRMSLVVGAMLAGAISFMPAAWTSRMDTIQSYTEDSSAMSRIFVWRTMWAAAVDRPLVGAGFAADQPHRVPPLRTA
jgi:hypothetical protein